MNKKFQVFVSSTYEDLKEERDQVIKTCLKMGQIPVGMEMFNAADEEQWQVIQRTIDLCDYYCVIVARRYGSRGSTGKSFTEMEFDYAVSQQLPVLRFLLNESASWPGDKADKKAADLKALEVFRGKLKSKMVSFWRQKHELATQFSVSLSEAMNLHPRPGWIRAEDQSYEAALAEIARLSSESAKLRQELETLKAQQHGAEDMEQIRRELGLKFVKVDEFQVGSENKKKGITYLVVFQQLAKHLIVGCSGNELIVLLLKFSPSKLALSKDTYKAEAHSKTYESLKEMMFEVMTECALMGLVKVQWTYDFESAVYHLTEDGCRFYRFLLIDTRPVQIHTGK